MTLNEINQTIQNWSDWATTPTNKSYDIALFKIWINFEKFISELFVQYAIGNPSEAGHKPNLLLQFNSEEQLNAFLRGDKKYVEYTKKIENLSKHIFLNNPFDVIFLDSNNKSAFNQMVAIRNYIAHESGEAKKKLINLCFNGNDEDFREPNQFLQEREPITKDTYFTYYLNTIRNICNLLISPCDN